MNRTRRHDIRLPEFDYSSPGIYNVTITLRQRYPLFGHITDAGVELSDAGRMIEAEWQQLPSRFPWLSLDTYLVMPDHFHTLLVFGADPGVEGRVPLSQVIGAFKSITTLKYGHGVRASGWLPYEGKLWLENYFERVVRNDMELEKFRNYIRDNPYRWLAKQEK